MRLNPKEMRELIHMEVTDLRERHSEFHSPSYLILVTSRIEIH